MLVFSTSQRSNQVSALNVEHKGKDLIVQDHSHRRTPIVAATPELLAITRQIRAQQKTVGFASVYLVAGA